ncbi:MAG TPA: hypothetical protein VGN25_06410 [Solirubrobacteraceae bacterium]|nr:hypothetical protein [Solirubrobacteraceae bacterium]
MGIAQVAVMGWAALLCLAWAIAFPRTPDMAAQVYRVGLFRHLGLAVWDEHWYAGHDLPGYSLLFGPLGALLGIRVVGVLAVLASTALFERLVRPVYGDGARWGAALFAVAAVGDVWAGRVTFALGVALALGSVLALQRRRTAWAVVLGVACAAASPVAGALLGLTGLIWTLARRSPRPLVALAVPAAVLVLALAWLFPEGGYEPYPILSFAATVGVVALCLLALPARERTLRIGGAVYLLACLACLVIHSPVGSNVERYGVLLAGPLLACAALGVREEGRPRSVGAFVVASVALCTGMVWVVWGPVRETLAVAGSDATSASYYEPVERFLASRPGPVRVEVPLTRSHWEAALLAPSVSLARGWEKQLDSRYDGVLLAKGLNADSYERWLHEQAVAYVALPDVALDPSSAREGRLIRGGLPYLREVFTSAHWRIYEVLSPTPLVSGAGRLTALGHDSFVLRVPARGSYVVRVRYTRYWTVTGGAGCVSEAPGGWTRVSASGPATVSVAARFSFARVFSSASVCRRSTA